MRVEFHARSPQRRKFRNAKPAAVVLGLLVAFLASARFLTVPFALAPLSLDFSNVPVGRVSQPRFVEVRNPDARGKLHIESVALAGSNAAAFDLSWSGCENTTIAPYHACMIGVSFHPAEIGRQTASLQVSSGPGGQRSVRLTGTGQAPVPPVSQPPPPVAPPLISATIAPTVVQFGSVTVGSGAERNLTITSSGNTAVRLGQAQVAGEHWNDFRIINDTCSHHSLSGSCSIRVSFIPGEPGQHKAVITVTDNTRPGRETA